MTKQDELSEFCERSVTAHNAEPDHEQTITDLLHELAFAGSVLAGYAENGSLAAQVASGRIHEAICAIRPEALAKTVPIHELLTEPGIVERRGLAPGWATHALLASLTDSMGPAKNYVEHKVTYRLGEFIVTIQKQDGKSPADMKREADERAERAEARASRLESALRQLTTCGRGEEDWDEALRAI